MQNSFNILFISDIVGKPGRRMILERLHCLKKKFKAMFIIANAEQACGYDGLTIDVVYHLFQHGIDIITTGSKVWKKKELHSALENEARLLRPLNYPANVPGSGFCFVEKKGFSLAVCNLQGRIPGALVENPFTIFQEKVESLRKQSDLILIDFHGGQYDERLTFAHLFDEKISCVVGTGSHVQTADAKILPGKTAYISDAGLTGAIDSVCGYDICDNIYSYTTQIDTEISISKNPPMVQGVVININKDNYKANSIERFSLELEELS